VDTTAIEHIVHLSISKGIALQGEMTVEDVVDLLSPLDISWKELMGSIASTSTGPSSVSYRKAGSFSRLRVPRSPLFRMPRG
jgi:hypothetical protein